MSTSPTRKYRRDYGEGHVIDDDIADSAAARNETVDTVDNNTPIAQSQSPSHPAHDDADADADADLVIPKSSWPILLYVPNLLGYLRIFLSVYGLILALQEQVSFAMNAWTVASLLDLFDGIAARRLNQCSKFGVLLDILADNILRTIIWIAVIVENLKHNDNDASVIAKVCCWTALICLEWITMVCSQCNQANSESGHWKDFQQGRKAPFWIEAVFKNNFKSVFGVMAIFGLFVAPFGSYVWAADRLTKTTWPWIFLLESEYAALVLTRSAYAGRLVCVVIEGWLCMEYVSCLIHHDLHSKQKIR